MLKLAIGELVIITLGSGFGVACYASTYQRGCRTYSILVLALALVAVASAWVARRAAGTLGLSRWRAFFVTSCCAGLAIFATAWVTMAALLNIFGS